jgi:hypothetical protein
LHSEDTRIAQNTEVQTITMQSEKAKTETIKVVSLQNGRLVSRRAIICIIAGILLLLMLVHIGFYKTYIRHFPKFEDVKLETGTRHFGFIQHFHGMMMMGWILMLLVQPILILKGKIKLHRLTGRLSYVLAPLVMLAIYLANQSAYYRYLKYDGQTAALAHLALSFPQIVFFAVLYFLAIFYRRRPALHMRFMCSTAFLFINPALDRALVAWLSIRPGFPTGIIIVIALAGIIATIDSMRTKRISPFTLVLGFLLLHKIFYDLKDTTFWQSIGKVIAKMF